MASRLDDAMWHHGMPYRQWSLQDRLDTLADAYSSPRRREKFKARIFEERDIDFYVNSSVNTVNPQNKRNKYVPLLSCLRQAEFLAKTQWCKEEGIDMATFKTRKVGVSWYEMADESFDWLVTPGYSSIVGSRIDSLVDSPGKANMNALFPKFDYIIENLDDFIKPEGYSDRPPWRVDFLRQNITNGAQIYGEAVTPNFGAGGRGGKAIVDEASRCQWCKPAWVSAGQTASSRHAVLTPFGKNFGWGLCFPDEYMLLTSEEQVERPECFRIIWKDIPWFNQFYIFPYEVPNFVRRAEFDAWWEDHRAESVVSGNGYSPFDEIGGPKDGLGIPFGCGYDDGRGNITHLDERMPVQSPPDGAVPEGVVYPWRVREGFRYDKAGAAQELDCQFEESKTGRVYAVQIQHSRKVAEVARDSKYPLYCFADPGGGKDNAFYMGWVQWNHDILRYQTLMEITYEGVNGYYFLPFLTGSTKHYVHLEKYARNRKDYEIFEALRHPMWRPNMVVGDPAGMGAKMPSSQNTLAQVWRVEGVPVYYNYEHRYFNTRIEACRRVLEYTEFSRMGTPRLLMGLTMIAFPEVKEDTQSRSEAEGWAHHPIHSHPVSAWEYFCCYDPHRYDGEQYVEEAPEQRYKHEPHAYTKTDMDRVVSLFASASGRPGGRYGRRSGY